MPVMWQSGFKAVVLMTKAQYRSEMLYQMALSVAKTMRNQGIISAEEYAKMDGMLIKKYQPFIGRLTSDNA